MRLSFPPNIPPLPPGANDFLWFLRISPGVRGLFDGISGTWLRQMSYSMCRFWAYDESKKLIGATKDSPAWKLAVAGSMGQ